MKVTRRLESELFIGTISTVVALSLIITVKLIEFAFKKITNSLRRPFFVSASTYTVTFFSMRIATTNTYFAKMHTNREVFVFIQFFAFVITTFSSPIIVKYFLNQKINCSKSGLHATLLTSLSSLLVRLNQKVFSFEDKKNDIAIQIPLREDVCIMNPKKTDSTRKKIHVIGLSKFPYLSEINEKKKKFQRLIRFIQTFFLKTFGKKCKRFVNPIHKVVNSKESDETINNKRSEESFLDTESVDENTLDNIDVCTEDFQKARPIFFECDKKPKKIWKIKDSISLDDSRGL